MNLNQQNLSSVGERLKYLIIDVYRLNIKMFARKCGDQHGQKFYNLIAGRNDISQMLLAEIRRAYPEININWLVKGEGNPLLAPIPGQEEITSDIAPEVPSIVVTKENGIRYYPDLIATAGEVDGFQDNELYSPYRLLYFPGLEGCAAFSAVGQSMEPTIHSGDVIVHKLWEERHIQNGELYVIVTRSGMRTVKRLAFDRLEDNGEYKEAIYVCYSDNPDKERYRPFEVRASDIGSLSFVMAIVPKLA